MSLGDCSFYWYWWNSLPSLLKLSFHNFYEYIMHCLSSNDMAIKIWYIYLQWMTWPSERDTLILQSITFVRDLLSVKQWHVYGYTNIPHLSVHLTNITIVITTWCIYLWDNDNRYWNDIWICLPITWRQANGGLSIKQEHDDRRHQPVCQEIVWP
jgi:hypothetical protein